MTESKQKLADALSEIGSSKQLDIPVGEIAARHDIPGDLLSGALEALSPFGAIDLTPAGTVNRVSEPAGMFLQSLSFFIRKESRFVDDWHRLGADCNDSELLLERGVCLLSAVEKRRALQSPDSPLRELCVVKGVVKGESSADRTPLFLMHFDSDANRLQLIGGEVRRGETPEVALIREFNEEVPGASLKAPAYRLRRIGDGPLTEQFVSPTLGAFSKYVVHYFHIELTAFPPVSNMHQWITLPELLRGQSDAGAFITPPKEVVEQLRDDLKRLNVSVPGPVSWQPHSSNQATPKLPRQAESFFQSNIGRGTVSLIATVVVSFGALILSARFAPQQFSTILLACIPLMVLGLAFTARAAGLFSAEQTKDIFDKVLSGRSSQR